MRGTSSPGRFSLVSDTRTRSPDGRLEARGLLEEVARDATTMSAMGVGRAMQLAWLGEACLLEGRLDDALARAQQAVSLAQRHQERSHEAWSLRLLGEIASHRDPPRCRKGGRLLPRGLGPGRRARHASARRPLPLPSRHALRKADQREQAREHLTDATTMYREMGMRVWLDQAGGGDAAVGMSVG